MLKKKQLQIIQKPNSGHNIIHEESTSPSTANVGQQQSQATFHCALNDEVSSTVECHCAQWIYCKNYRSLATLSVLWTMTALLLLQ